MTEKMKLVMATNNAGKLREARAIAGDRIEILSLDDIGFHNDIEETADTLDGNALIKVRSVKEATGYDCFADDTGLMVEALGGAPGVYTARYAGEGCNSEDNIELMLKNMEGVKDRRAYFRTSVALTLNGEEHIFHGEAAGSIATERSGSHGFGYDPIFISSETGKCFADMSDEAKNAISHRGRAISAMMRWLGALCMAIFTVFQTSAADVATSGWRLHNTFDDKVEKVIDTPDKTYFLAQAQYVDRNPVNTDNHDSLFFLFSLEKESGEVRPYNALNMLDGTLIRMAEYNAGKRYLMMVYDDYTIDILHDDGKVYSILGLKNYGSQSTKNVRSISFDPEFDRAYLSTDFGIIAVNDKKNEIASSYIYGTPVDRAVRVGDRFLILRDGKLYQDSADSRHGSISDFNEAQWGDGDEAVNLVRVSDSQCIFSRKRNGEETHFLATFTGETEPKIAWIGNISDATFVENKDGLFLSRTISNMQIDRKTGEFKTYPRMEEDYGVVAGSWDMKDFHFARRREGFYSKRLNEDGSYTLTSQAVRPNSPAVFRSNNLLYSPRYGMLVNTHGVSQNFNSHNADNPLLLSGLKDGEWSIYGLPYLDPSAALRICNPCGIARDPDDPDVFYFGSVLNGLVRYNLRDVSTLLHMTRSDDAPDLPGHVSLQPPYASWGNAFMLENPLFDTRGNLIVAHNNTNDPAVYKSEIWIWPAESRKATTGPETFRPFERLKVNDVAPSKSNIALPLSGSASKDMVVFFALNKYGQPFVVYDHNGTPSETSDDRQVTMRGLVDADGEVTYNYIYCAMEDPATGLVWVGSDNGVFTFNPASAFNNPGVVSRIKVSRNDGTSLADFLLANTPVNHIAIDGAGRKWFSLSGGGLVCTSADGKTIVQEINTDNSMLPSDMVYASCYNPDSNSLTIGTSAGICEYFLSGQATHDGKTEVRAYPNPVRHDYYGLVTIDGLEDEAIVKIADSAGNIVRELGPASAGKVQWDVCGMDLNRVPSGVYFVLASSGSQSGSFNEATKILVINR